MSDKTAETGEKIIDTEVEPLGRANPRRGWRVAAYLSLAVLGSIAVAVLYHLWSTDRLDQLTGGRTAPAPSTSSVTLPVAPPPAPAAPASPDPAQAQRLDALEQRLAALTAGIERLQQLPAASNADQQKLADLESKLQAAEANRADLEQKIALLIQTAEAQTAQRSSLQQQTAALQQQLADLQGRLAGMSDSRAAALREPLMQLLAWGELRERARRGQRFTAEASAISAYAERQGGALQQAAAAWAPFAEQTPPAMMQLGRRFAPLVQQQLARPTVEAQPDPATRAWWQRALDKVTGLVSIRKVGGAAEAAPETRLAEAEAAMAAGNPRAALAALDGLELLPDFAAWREQLKARLALNAALDGYGAALRTHLAALQ